MGWVGFQKEEFEVWNFSKINPKSVVIYDQIFILYH